MSDSEGRPDLSSVKTHIASPSLPAKVGAFRRISTAQAAAAAAAMMESLRTTYKDEEEDEEWSDALHRCLPPSSTPPRPSDAVGALPPVTADLPLPRAPGGFPPLPPVVQDAAQQQEGPEMGGESVPEGVSVEDGVGGGGFGVVGEERVEERGGCEDRLEEEHKEMGEGRPLPMEGDEEMEEGEEDEEDEQEEGEDDDDDEEEGLEEERGGGRQPSTPPSTPPPPPSLPKFSPLSVPDTHKLSNGEYDDEEDEEEGEEEGNVDEDDDSSEANGRPPKKKQKSLTCFMTPSSATHIASAANLSAAADEATPPAGSSTQLDASASTAKKSKKKSNNVRKKSTSRKSKKKGKSGGSNHFVAPEDKVLITPIARFPDKTDDTPDATICLSRVYKAEKVELSEDRLTAGSTKGYRMVRATRGVIEGAWYFEISVVHLGETGHTRLGWTTEKGDLQAPVGYDSNSFGYRDIDGTKIHKALREKYGDQGYADGDVIGFYINLPDGASFAPKPPNLVWYKGQRYMYSADGKEEPLKVVPGSDLTFFKNGVCQGIAFTDLFGGRYYPAASMYTLPNQPNCEVRFNFGPNFEFFPEDFGGRPVPRPMIEVPYHGCGGKVEGHAENGVSEKKQPNGASS